MQQQETPSGAWPGWWKRALVAWSGYISGVGHPDVKAQAFPSVQGKEKSLS
jgi:hypothetical protein